MKPASIIADTIVAAQERGWDADMTAVSILVALDGFGWAVVSASTQSDLAAPQSDDPAQPERDPHRDGCVHDPAWACEDCLAARSAAPQPADNAQSQPDH